MVLHQSQDAFIPISAFFAIFGYESVSGANEQKNAKTAKTEVRSLLILAGDMPHGQKPQLKRLSISFKDRACRHRSLVMIDRTFTQPVSAR